MDKQILDINIFIQDYKDLIKREQQQINQLYLQKKFQQTKNNLKKVENQLSFQQDIQDYPSKNEFFNKIVQQHIIKPSQPIQEISKDDNKKLNSIEEEQSENSETISLSFIKEQQQQQQFSDSLDWKLVLNNYGNLFRPFSDQTKYIKTGKFNQILNNIKDLYIDQGSDTKIYSAINIDQNDWIVIREQLVANKPLLEAAQQYILHHLIYQLYPKIFLQLLLPVYVKIDQFERATFISQLEYGEINLYNYSQQNCIKGEEYQLIFQQLYEQIKLLHKHKIAHRDIKPQNIIFVENKGWLLCDFGDSLSYNEVIGVYNIRGTYAFLKPQLQQQSKIQGIMLEQNLIQNDIYALAITLIVIKHQIKYQKDITDYLLKEDDPIINFLVNTSSFDNLNKINDQEEIRYIKPQIAQKQQQKNKEIDLEECQSYLAILQNTSTLYNLTDELITKIIQQIDQKLQLKDQHYYHINHSCYVCIPNYLKQFKNLIKYQNLRQVKYWKRQSNYSKNHGFIIFMDAIGLTNITYQYAKYFLQDNYDFTIHIIVIKNLLLFQEIDQAKQEFYQILRFREFKQMTEVQLHLLVEVTLNLLPWDMLNVEDIKFFKQIGIQGNYCDWGKIISEELNKQEFLEKSLQFINSTVNSYKDRKLSLGFIFSYIELSFKSKNISITLDLINQIMSNNLKYYCTTFHWQKLIQYVINIHILLGDKKREKYLFKKMNYIVIFNSESAPQQQILRLFKLSLLSNQKIKTKQKNQKILKQLEKIMSVSKQLTFHYYTFILIKEIIDVIFNQFYQDSIFRYFKIVICIFQSKALRQYLSCEAQTSFILFTTQFYLETINKRRFKQMLMNKNDQNILEKNFRKDTLIPSKKKLLKFNNYERLENEFQLNLFLQRV